MDLVSPSPQSLKKLCLPDKDIYHKYHLSDNQYLLHGDIHIFYTLVIALKCDFVGRCGFGPIETSEVEVGYLLHKIFWGQGYASEALMFLLGWAKENIHVECMIAFVPIERLNIKIIRFKK